VVVPPLVDTFDVEAVTPAGAPSVCTLTVPVKPPDLVIEAVKEPDPPCTIVRALVLSEIEIAGLGPGPLGPPLSEPQPAASIGSSKAGRTCRIESVVDMSHLPGVVVTAA